MKKRTQRAIAHAVNARSHRIVVIVAIAVALLKVAGYFSLTAPIVEGESLPVQVEPPSTDCVVSGKGCEDAYERFIQQATDLPDTAAVEPTVIPTSIPLPTPTVRVAPTAEPTIVVVDNRAEHIKAVLQRYGSPMAEYAPDFVRIADTYGVDVALALGITRKETSFGKSACFGHRYNIGCHRIFRSSVNSFVEGFEEHVKLLASPLYKGLTVEQIIYKYAPPVENNTDGYIQQLHAFMEELHG
jgi:hypothetical protein